MSDAVVRPGGAAALALERLAVPFGAERGLADVSLAVAAGERVAVVGPSGVGKTTLLRAVAGLAPLAAGHVRVGGRDVGALPPERRDAVYLHQTPVLFAHLSVGENVAFPLRVRGRRGEAVRRRVGEALAAVRLDGFEPRGAHELSGGQRHRVALARAIAARPSVLLLDEPLSALDPALRDDVRAAIAAAQAEYEPAMLLVTHDLDDAGLLANRVAVLLDGGVAQVAPPATLFARPATLGVARFLGLFQEVPGVRRTDGTIVCALGAVAAGAEGADAAVAARRLVVAFRADAVRVVPPADGVPRARVVAVRHRARGTTVLLHVDDGAAGLEVEAAAEPRGPRWTPGEAVGAALDPGAALVFPA